MAKVVLISKNEEYKNFLNGEEIYVSDTLNEDIFDFEPDVIILDFEIENSNIIFMDILNRKLNKEFDIFCLVQNNEIEICLGRKVKIFTKPVDFNILKNEIKNSCENKIQKTELQKENLELKKNLYQIDAFYNASSKFAGTLDKEKLYEVMFESLERVLSFDIASALFKDDFQNNKLKFYIKSLKKTTDETNSNLIKRLSLSARNEGLDEIKPNRYEVEIIQHTKPSYRNEYYDPSLAGFDAIIAPILIKDKFEGIVEVFRKNPFTKEDVTCFQSIIHQVLAPLRSAILYEEIIKTNSKLTKLEKIKSEFVSIVSHELRTPLTPINNALNIILSEQGGKIGDINKNFANMAKRNVERLSGIIEDLLDLSRMQTGKFDFKFKKASIYNSIELAYNTYKNQAASKNIEFLVDVEENMPDIYADSHRIDQILSNLITNALKFTESGGKITIGAKLAENINKEDLISPYAKDYNGKFVQLFVKDTGVGIEKEDIPKIFDKFSQIEDTLSRNTGGIGLGLTITKHFIDTHLGGIFVESTKNEGSAFNVLLPLYNEKNAFDIDLNLKIKNEKETAYLEIKEENDTQKFYNRLKDLNIIKLTKESKEYAVFNDNKYVTKVFISGLDKNAYEFMISAIENEMNKKEENYDIVLTKAYYKKDIN